MSLVRIVDRDGSEFELIVNKKDPKKQKEFLENIPIPKGYNRIEVRKGYRIILVELRQYDSQSIANYKSKMNKIHKKNMAKLNASRRAIYYAVQEDRKRRILNYQ
ncbi:MAG: hypothetical protein ABIH65_00240 [Nanoarchaeota archaeon]